jgi:nucleoside-diphosphate-sugar epimerase
VEQVHGDSKRPEYLNDQVELVVGDVRDAEVLRSALDGVDAVFHLAARVGVGQSMYAPADYAGANSLGKGLLLDTLLERPVRKLVVASSMSIDVYGPRQALSNPCTGALAIFASRLLNDRPPIVYEDGGQRRDFVNVADVARACRLALERGGADGRPVNVGSGRSATILEVAHELGRVLGKEIEPELPGSFRAGDIRHCFADVTLARDALGFEAEVPLEEGMSALAEWLEGQVAADRFDAAAAELAERGLTR